jgi:O-succinylbenzoic acid--CoA ligase
MDRSQGFTPAAFADATAHMPGGDHPAYVSLVPTQVTRLLRDARGRAALARFRAVLCGGAATPPSLRVAAAAAGVRLVATYGMTETCGGCVYDAIPLPTTHIHIDNDRHVVLGGPMVAAGYLGEPDLTADHFQTDADGLRWFRTDDLGALDDEGKLTITGRADDLINTGGVKVAPGPIEDALVRFVPGVCDAVVVGVPDPAWGQVVAAVVTLLPGVSDGAGSGSLRGPDGGGTGAPTVSDARAALRGILPDAALPRLLQVVDAFPAKGPGKPDRAAISASFAPS